MKLSKDQKAYNKAVVNEWFSNNVQPLTKNFVFPHAGDKIMVLKNFKLPSGELLIEGDAGYINEIRKPGTYNLHHGYIGCGVYFEKSKKYPCGVIIPWNIISDTETFEIIRVKLHGR